MQKTSEFLDAICDRYTLTSDNQLSKKLGFSRAAISAYRHGKRSFDENSALRVAELLEIEPAVVCVCAQIERAKTDSARAVWESILAKFPRPATEGKRTGEGGKHCILCEIPRTPRNRKNAPHRAIVPAAILAISHALRPVRAFSA